MASSNALSWWNMEVCASRYAWQHELNGIAGASMEWNACQSDLWSIGVLVWNCLTCTDLCSDACLSDPRMVRFLDCTDQYDSTDSFMQQLVRAETETLHRLPNFDGRQC